MESKVHISFQAIGMKHYQVVSPVLTHTSAATDVEKELCDRIKKEGEQE